MRPVLDIHNTRLPATNDAIGSFIIKNPTIETVLAEPAFAASQSNNQQPAIDDSTNN